MGVGNMKRLTSAEVHARKVAELGLDAAAVDLETAEGIAAALRRAAGYLCPCTAVTLVRAVTRPLRGLVRDEVAAKLLVEETLEAMIAHGDLLEEPDAEGKHLLYATPASFVIRSSGLAILLGIVTDHISALPEDLEKRIEYVGHVRRLAPLEGQDLRNELRELGLIELTAARWLNSPPREPAAIYLAQADRALDAVSPSRDVPGLVILDPVRPVHFYPARWDLPKAQTGRFVARRTQAYGADLWSYVELRDGQPERLIDFPAIGSRWRGCDEAWRLQMAIDAHRGRPQLFRVRGGAAPVLELLSPLPAWARRRWDAIGEPVQRSGCLFAYRIPNTEIDEERRFARETLWLDETTESREGRRM